MLPRLDKWDTIINKAEQNIDKQKNSAQRTDFNSV